MQMQNLDSIILFPTDRLLKTDLRGSRGDLRRPFDRSWKDYHERFADLERQKKKAAKEAGEETQPTNPPPSFWGNKTWQNFVFLFFDIHFCIKVIHFEWRCATFIYNFFLPDYVLLKVLFFTEENFFY